MKKSTLNNGLTAEEIVDGMVPPVDLASAQKGAADQMLAVARKTRRETPGKDADQRFQLRKLRFQLENISGGINSNLIKTLVIFYMITSGSPRGNKRNLPTTFISITRL